MGSSLTLQFVGAGGGLTAARWLNLEQDVLPVVVSAVNLSDVNQMIARAQSGLSARTLLPDTCPVEVSGRVLIINLDFFVYPSDMTMPYSLESDFGDITGPERVDRYREFDVVFPLSDRVALEFLLTGSVTWQSQTYDAAGSPIPPPGLSITDGVITADISCFGVVRVAGVSHGYRHRLAITVPLVPGAEITGLNPSVQAIWMDGETVKAEILALNVPDCVVGLIAECPAGEVMVSGRVVDDDTPDLIPVVYYSTCTGNMLGLRYE